MMTQFIVRKEVIKMDKDKVLQKLVLSDRELQMFDKLKSNYYVTDKLFYKNNILYSIKIIYKGNAIIYQLKENRKIILETKNVKTLENKIIRILEKQKRGNKNEL